MTKITRSLVFIWRGVEGVLAEGLVGHLFPICFLEQSRIIFIPI